MFPLDGNILQWTKFWEQFDLSIQSKTQLTYVEKLAYLRHALKDGPALPGTKVQGNCEGNDYSIGYADL